MTKPRPPRPVRAWAETVSATDLRIACDQCGGITVAKTREQCVRDSMGEGARPIRVTLVPDGATSAEAECRRLRRALREVRRLLFNSSGFTGRAFLMSQIDAALRRKGGSR